MLSCFKECFCPKTKENDGFSQARRHAQVQQAQQPQAAAQTHPIAQPQTVVIHASQEQWSQLQASIVVEPSSQPQRKNFEEIIQSNVPVSISIPAELSIPSGPNSPQALAFHAPDLSRTDKDALIKAIEKMKRINRKNEANKAKERKLAAEDVNSNLEQPNADQTYFHLEMYTFNTGSAVDGFSVDSNVDSNDEEHDGDIENNEHEDNEHEDNAEDSDTSHEAPRIKIR